MPRKPPADPVPTPAEAAAERCRRLRLDYDLTDPGDLEHLSLYEGALTRILEARFAVATDGPFLPDGKPHPGLRVERDFMQISITILRRLGIGGAEEDDREPGRPTAPEYSSPIPARGQR